MDEINKAIEIISQNAVPSFPAKVTLEEWRAAKELAIKALQHMAEPHNVPMIGSTNGVVVEGVCRCGAKLEPYQKKCNKCNHILDWGSND